MATVNQNLEIQINAQNNTGAAFTGVRSNASSAFGNGPGGLGMLGVSAAAAMAAIGAAVLSVGAGLRAASETAASFERAMSRVGALSGANKRQMDELTAAARSLGETTVFSASQAAEGMSALAMAGFDTNQIIAAMPGLLATASAAQSDLGETADIVSNILSGFGIDATETNRVADILTSTFTSSNTTLSSLGESMKYVGPVANSLGQEINVVAAAVGIMGNAGLQGSIAGTALRTSLTQLAAPTATAANRLDDLNIELHDARGVMLPLPAIIGNIQRGMGNLDPSEQTQLIKELVGTEAMSGLMVLLEAGPSKIQAYADKLENDLGAAARIAAQQTDNLEGSYTRLGSAWEGLLITIGDRLNPALKSLTDEGLIPLIGAVQALFNEIKPQGDALELVGEKTHGVSEETGLLTVSFVRNKVALDSLKAAVRGFTSAAVDQTETQQELNTKYQEGGRIYSTATPQVIAATLAVRDQAAATEDLGEKSGPASDVLRDDLTPALRGMKEETGKANIEMEALPGNIEDAAAASTTSAFSQFTTAFRAALLNPSTGLEASIANVFSAFTTGGPRQAITAAAVAIGNMLAGPIGGAVAAAITRNIDLGRSSREAEGIVGEVLRAGSLEYVDKAAVGDLSAMNFSETTDLLKRELGISDNEATAFAQALYAIKEGQSPEQLRSASPEIYNQINSIIRAEVVKRLADDIKRNTEIQSFTDTLTQDAEAIAAGRAPIVSGISTGTAAPPPTETARPVVQQGGTSSEALAYLSSSNATKTISRSRLQSLGFSAVNDALNFFGATGVAKEIFKSIARGETAPWQDQAREDIQGGWNIVAAQGYSGIVNRPTSILAGEAGPEYVDISPMTGSATGGSGRGQTVLHFNINVSTPDTGSMKRWVERELFPMIQRQMVRSGRSGEGLLPQKAVMAA